MSEDRSEMEAARLVGLAKRHETREARAVRSDPVKALRYLLAQYDRVVEIHEHVVMDTPEDRELHDRAIATFREAAEPIRTALADFKEPTLTASEVKVLTETAAEIGRRIGRKDAGEEIAAMFERLDNSWSVLTFDAASKIALEVSAQPPGDASDATSGVPRHSEVSEAVRSPREPCGHPTCPCTSQEAR